MMTVALGLASAADSSGSGGMDMMEDGPSVAIFVGLVVAVSVIAVLVFPIVFRRLSLAHAVPGLALIGPILALIGGIIGTGAMTLSGRDIWFSLLVALAAAASAIVVGLRLARPVAHDLGQISETVKAVAGGDRQAETGIDRPDEIGELAIAVDDLASSLAKAEAERLAAEDERNAVVGALSHDLRTPLASLLVSVDAIEDGIGDPTAHLRAMRGNISALEQLIGDLFLLARVDAGALALGFETLDLAELIDETVEACSPLANGRAIRIETDFARPVMVEGDHAALARVFRNLLDNAIRHSPADAPVRVEHQLGADSVAVAVVDRGEGFSPDFAPEALKRFTQADHARSRSGTGGLGLAIVDSLVSAHRGEVRVETGPGGRVEVRLPRR